jgi:hypothetical protein
MSDVDEVLMLTQIIIWWWLRFKLEYWQIKYKGCRNIMCGLWKTKRFKVSSEKKIMGLNESTSADEESQKGIEKHWSICEKII